MDGGDDTARGGGGDDIIAASTGDNVLLGGPGSDMLFGGDGMNELIGGKGNDFLHDFYGGDSLTGGPGDDTFRVAAGKSPGGQLPALIFDFPADVLNPPQTFIEFPVITGNSIAPSAVVENTVIEDFGVGNDRIEF